MINLQAFKNAIALQKSVKKLRGKQEIETDQNKVC